MYENLPVSITETELDETIAGNLEFQEDRPAFDHAYKPAFMRMLLLYPELTKHIVLTMSAPESMGAKHQYRLIPELFAAYQIMSQLVDKNDEYVTHPNGMVDKLYLCR